MEMSFKIELENGKYSFVNDNGVVKILLYSEECQEETGNSSLLCLLQYVEQLEESKKSLEEALSEMVKRDDDFRIKIIELEEENQRLLKR
ncbi:hypothetical protein ACOI1C_12830 [Bacillus sp. DJP31]|uniref:hypothetical protein n=1 Tax=Bacillus sp. DJP31 TaxID=3409789 RepID=UPI003BB52786